MGERIKYDLGFWLKSILLSFWIHCLFCLQAFAALVTGACLILNDFFFYVFFPHLAAIIVLFPGSMADTGIDKGEINRWPWYLKWLGVDWADVDWMWQLKCLIAAYPASLLYGIIFLEIWCILKQKWQSKRPPA